MGFIDILKKWFSKEPVETVQEMTITECQSWISEVREQKLQELQQKREPLRLRIEQEIQLTREHLQNLAQATLHNPNIPERAKNFMEGNRKTYIFKVEQFLKEIDLPTDIQQMPEFSVSQRNRLEELAKSTARSYQILQEFFAHDVTAIAGNLKSFDRIARDIQDSIPDVSSFDDLLLKISELQSQQQRQQQQKSEEEELQQLLQQQGKIVQEYEGKLQKLTESEEYQKQVQKILVQEEYTEKLKQVEEKFAQSFGVIQTALKKYSRISLHEKLITNYLTDPLPALLNDKELQIVDLVNQMKEQILEEKIELKDKKRQKTLQASEWFTRENLQSIIQERQVILDKIAAVQEELSAMRVLSEKEQLEKDKEKTEQEQLQLMKELESKKKQEKIYVGELEGEIRNKLGKSVRIVMG